VSRSRRASVPSLERWFVYLRGIEIKQADVEHLLASMATFFDLPAAAKKPLVRARRANADLRCGYVPRGREHEDSSTPSDIKEAFDLFRGDGYYRAAFASARSDEPTFAPAVQALVDDFATFHARCAAVANDVLRTFAINFRLPESYFVERHGQNNILRLLHYPPVSDAVLAGQMRVGSHTDFGTLTLLFQDPTAGLEVLSAGGRWLTAPWIPGTVLINIGDLMQQWTNCDFRSTLIASMSRAERARSARDIRSRSSANRTAKPRSPVFPRRKTATNHLRTRHRRRAPLARLDRTLIEKS